MNASMLFYISALPVGEPGKLIRERYRAASQVVQNQVKKLILTSVVSQGETIRQRNHLMSSFE